MSELLGIGAPTEVRGDGVVMATPKEERFASLREHIGYGSVYLGSQVHGAMVRREAEYLADFEEVDVPPLPTALEQRAAIDAQYPAARSPPFAIQEDDAAEDSRPAAWIRGHEVSYGPVRPTGSDWEPIYCLDELPKRLERVIGAALGWAAMVWLVAECLLGWLVLAPCLGK